MGFSGTHTLTQRAVYSYLDLMRFLLSRGLELFAMENDNLRTLAIVLS